jgi:hypothetical protein
MINIPPFLNTLLTKAKSLVMEELNPDVTSGQSIPESTPIEPSNITQNVVEIQPAPVKKITWLKGITAIFNGIGIGFLLGILLSLSLSPVVSGVIATLSGLLAVLLGLDEKYLDPLKSLRIGAFGFSAVAGILLGLYIRAHDPFSPSLLDKKNEYVKLGFSESEAKSFIMKTIKADTAKHLDNDNVLYAATVSLNDCEDKLSVAKPEWPSSEIVNTFNYAGGTWAEFAKVFHADLPDELVGKALLTMRDCFCGKGSEGKIEMINLEEIRKLGKDDSVERIEEVLSSPASGNSWQTIVSQVHGNIAENQRQIVYLSVIKVLSHE